MKTRMHPATPIVSNGLSHTGLSIRDEFAKAAMQGLLANPNYNLDYNEVAARAVAHADALASQLGY